MFPANENRRACMPNWLRILALTLCVTLTAPVSAGEPANAGDIVVVSFRGDVRVTMRGAPRVVRAGVVVELPATIRTGHDGAIDLRQGNTRVAIAADTELEMPPATDGSAIIDRLIQTRGNAFYDVGKRETRKLRVETPYLVAVIKGTQFNVAVQEDSSTISLFEGRLEVRAPDDSDVVDLNAGEIAIRHSTDKAIRVLRMDGSKPVATTSNDGDKRFVGPASGGADSAASPPRVLPPSGDPGDVVVGRDATIHVTPPGGETVAGVDMRAEAANATVTLETGDGSVDAGLAAKVGDAVAVQVDAGVDLGVGAVDASASTSVDLGGVSAAANLDAGVNLDAGTIDVGAGTSVDLGAASVDAGLDAAVDLGAAAVDVAADVAVDLGAASADLGVDAAADLGAGTVDLGTDAAADLGVASLDTATDVGVDLGTGTVDVGAGLAADLGVAQVDAGLDVGLEPTAPAVDTGIDTSVAGVDVGVDLGVDLGSGDLDIGLGGLDIGLGTDSGADTSAPAPPPADDGGLLGGLLGGRRRN